MAPRPLSLLGRLEQALSHLCKKYKRRKLDCLRIANTESGPLSFVFYGVRVFNGRLSFTFVVCSHSEHREKPTWFSVAEHFIAAGHSIDDVLVRGILLCGVTSQQKRLELRLILKLATSHPGGVNSDLLF